MEPQIRFDRTVVTVNQDEQVNTLVSVTAPPAPDMERAELDIVFVIDNSGSMGGGPLEAVTEAVANVLRELGPHDRAGVVVFNSDAERILGLDRHVDQRAQRAVRAIRTAGSTNLSAGWLMALEMLAASPREQAVRRIVVLTDGHANQGIVEHDALSDMVAAGRRQGITTSCIGFGGRYDEDLLGMLANAGAGNDYFCEDSDAAAPVFRREFEGLASVVAQNLAITIEPTSAVAVVGVLNDFAIATADDGSVRVDLGDCFGSEERSILVRFALRPQPAGGSVHVADVVITWVGTVGGIAMHTARIPVYITAGASDMVDNGADPRVADEVVLLEAARDRREMRRLADQGDTESSLRMGRSALERLRTLPGRDREVSQLENEISLIENRGWDATTSKTAYVQMRAMSRKRDAYLRDEARRRGSRDSETSNPSNTNPSNPDTDSNESEEHNDDNPS